MEIRFNKSGWDIWQISLWDKVPVILPDGSSIVVELIGGQDQFHAINVYYSDGAFGSYSLKGAVLQLPYPGSGDKFYLRIQNATYTPSDPAWGVPGKYQEPWYAVPVYMGLSLRADGWPSDLIVPTRSAPLGIGETAGLALSGISADAALGIAKNLLEGDSATIQSVQPELRDIIESAPLAELIQAQQAGASLEVVQEPIQVQAAREEAQGAQAQAQGSDILSMLLPLVAIAALLVLALQFTGKKEGSPA